MVAAIRQDASLETVYDELVYTIARLLANPLTAPYAEAFERLLERWSEVNAIELRLRADIVRAQAAVSAVDDDLDALVETIVGAVLISYGNDKKHPEYIRYMGKKTLTQLKRPVLGNELEHVRSWPAALRSSRKELLVGLADRLESIIERADAAVDQQTRAEQANRDFRLVGERHTLIDDLNGTRTKTWGELSATMHKEQSGNLPKNFPDQPFRVVRRKSKTLDEQIAELTKKITDLEVKKAKRNEQNGSNPGSDTPSSDTPDESA